MERERNWIVGWKVERREVEEVHGCRFEVLVEERGRRDRRERREAMMADSA